VYGKLPYWVRAVPDRLSFLMHFVLKLSPFWLILGEIFTSKLEKNTKN